VSVVPARGRRQSHHGENILDGRAHFHRCAVEPVDTQMFGKMDRMSEVCWRWKTCSVAGFIREEFLGGSGTLRSRISERCRLRRR
jgi:hypothetical protein